jgi:hypothetical protein
MPLLASELATLPERGLRALINAWNSEILLQGVVVTITALAGAGTFNVDHALGRVATGFVVEGMDRASGTTSAISIYRRAGDTNDRKRLTLYSTGAFSSVRIRVF